MSDTEFIAWMIWAGFIGFCGGFCLAASMWSRLVDKYKRHLDWMRERAGL